MIRSLLLSIFSAIFVIIALPMSILWSVYSTAFDEDFYDDDLVEIFYEFASEEVATELSAEVDISKDELQDLLEEAITPEDLMAILKDVGEQFSETSVDAEGMVEIVIPLDWLTDKSDIIIDRASDFVYERDSIEVPEADFKTEFARQFDRDVLSDVPDELKFNFEVPLKEGTSIKDFFQSVFSQALIVGVIALLLLLFLISLLAFSPVVRIIKWNSGTLFFASLNVCILFLALLVSRNLFAQIYQLVGLDLSDVEFRFASDAYAYVTGALADSVLLYSLPILVGSLVLWIIAIIYGRAHRED